MSQINAYYIFPCGENMSSYTVAGEIAKTWIGMLATIVVEVNEAIAGRSLSL